MFFTNKTRFFFEIEMTFSPLRRKQPLKALHKKQTFFRCVLNRFFRGCFKQFV